MVRCPHCRSELLWEPEEEVWVCLLPSCEGFFGRNGVINSTIELMEEEEAK